MLLFPCEVFLILHRIYSLFSKEVGIANEKKENY